MKVKLFIIVGLAATSLAAYAQTNTAAGTDASAASVSTPATNDVAPASPAATDVAQAAAPATNDVAQAAAPATNDVAQAQTAPATNDVAQAAPPTNSAPTVEATSPAAAAPAPDAAAMPPTVTGTNGASPGAVIPLIVMDDVPLTDAIKNLARQAGLNYMLDPKVSFGQIGPDGRPVPQPTVSIRWENVTAQQALAALLGNYSLQLVEDPKSKIARIMVRDPAAPDPLVTKVIQLKFAAPSNIVSAINSVLADDKRSKVVPDIRTSQLVILATEKDMVQVDELVERLDTQTKQVLIEARLLETQFNPATSKGVDWTGTLQSQNVSFGNGITTGTTTTTQPGAAAGGTLPSGRSIPAAAPFQSVSTILNSVLGGGGLSLDTARGFNPATFFLNADGVHAVLSFLNTYSETKVISTPRTVTLDNEMAVIEVGTMYPIVNVTAGTVQVSGGSQITYSNLTVKLEVTPRISANNFVNLKVHPSVLRLGPQIKTTVAGQVSAVNEFFTRNAQTSVMIPSGNTLVMGGLISDEIDTTNIKVPVLGDIPGLGLLFRWDNKNRNKSNLLVFLTPTIVQDEDFQPTPTGFLKTPVPAKDTIEGDWSAWDSGKPKDWGKDKVQGTYDDSVQPLSGSSSATASTNP